VDQSDGALGGLPFKVSSFQVTTLNIFDFCGISLGEVGTGVLPFSIIPPDATCISAVWAAASNHVSSYIFDLSWDPTVGALSASDTQRLHSHKNYVPANWADAPVQLSCMLGFIAALPGDDHGITLTWTEMLHKYERVEFRLHHKINTEHGAVNIHLPPPVDSL
jgi:hypothetical protein